MVEKEEASNEATEQNEGSAQEAQATETTETPSAEVSEETPTESHAEAVTEVESKANPEEETAPEVPTKGFFQAQLEEFQSRNEPKPLVRKNRKERIGKVTSDKMNKTITVVVERKLKHPIYGKFLTKTKKFLVHDEKEDGHIGDTVKIMECRPLSKKKRWRLVEVIERAK